MLFKMDVKPNFTVENEAAVSAPPKVDFGKSRRARRGADRRQRRRRRRAAAPPTTADAAPAPAERRNARVGATGADRVRRSRCRHG